MLSRHALCKVTAPTHCVPVSHHGLVVLSFRGPRKLSGRCNICNVAKEDFVKPELIPEMRTQAQRHMQKVPLVFASPKAALGLRSARPPDSLQNEGPNELSNGKGSSKPTPEPGEQEPEELSDAEWEIRTGRAMFVLQETLPDFFNVGLVTNVDRSTGMPVIKSSVLPFAPTTTTIDPLDLRHHLNLGKDAGKGVAEKNTDHEPIYSPKIKLEYTPPSPLPPPFPRTLHVEGFPLYVASSSFMRHTMNALYSNLTLTLLKVSLDVPPSSNNEMDASAGSGEEARQPQTRYVEKQKGSLREKRLFVKFMVTGNTRVGGSINEWEVESTYIFSPITGLIHKHVINSIHPAPHRAVYDALHKLLGFGWSTGTGKGPATGTMCNPTTHSHK